jgi:GPH family glycoside/pentoside/hexuronide:cation symporter
MSLFPVIVFIPKFYTSEMGISLVLAANLILAVRLFDVVTDPLVGFLSDRTGGRFGRRKPWIAAATPVMMLSIYMLFLPPEGAGATHLFTWYMLLSLGTTMMLIPYYAWAAELSPDYNERSRITGWRSMLGVVGSLLAQLMPAGAALFFGITGSASVLQIVAATMLVVMPVCVVATLAGVPEAKTYTRSTTPFWEGLSIMWSNGPFKRLISAFFIGSLALNITTPLYLYFITFVLKAEDKAIYMLLFFYIANFLAVPFWVWLSGKIGKHRAYVASFATIAAAHPFYLLLGEGDFWYMLPITLVTGFAAGGFAALPNSMKADVIDLDTINTGENRAALFFSTWSFTYKLAAAGSTWLALMGLALVSFNTEPGGFNDANQLFGLRFLFALFPSIFFILAGVVIWKYPITEAVHKELRESLQARGLENKPAVASS